MLAEVYHSNRSVVNILFEADHTSRFLTLKLKLLYHFLSVLYLRGAQETSRKTRVRFFDLIVDIQLYIPELFISHHHLKEVETH